MKEEFVTDAVARQFLLGDVDDEERQRIEGLFLSDPEVTERVLVVEEDLIEDYLENSLITSDRDKFLAQYGHTSEERQQLRITQAIKEYAIAEAALAEPLTAPTSKGLTYASISWLRNHRFVIPVAAVLAIVFVVALVWLVGSSRRKAKDDALRLAIQREVADLNQPAASHREVAGQTLSLVLPPVSPRSVGSQTELQPQADTRVVELQLVWPQKERYPSYQAVLRRVGNPEQVTVSSLHVENNLGGAVTLRLPAHVLSHGLYQITLSGIDSTGRASQSEEYSFTVSGQ